MYSYNSQCGIVFPDISATDYAIKDGFMTQIPSEEDTAMTVHQNLNWFYGFQLQSLGVS